MTVAQFDSLTPHFAWQPFFAAVARPGLPWRCPQPDFFRAFDAMLVEVPVADWQAYLRWRVLRNAGTILHTQIVQENFRFSRQFSGAKELLPRWNGAPRRRYATG